ncbi:MAG: hypothetical protein V5783_08340 [Pontiella sp.]
MEQGKDSTQTRKGKYLNWNERILIEGFLRAGMSESNIAKELARDRRTITEKSYFSPLLTFSSLWRRLCDPSSCSGTVPF